jgi:hypothetical protein
VPTILTTKASYPSQLLAAYIGLSINPQSSTNFYNEDSLKFSAMGLGVALVLWSIYSTKIELKKHFFGFDFVYT